MNITSHAAVTDELFLWYGWPTKGVWPYFQIGPLSEIRKQDLNL